MAEMSTDSSGVNQRTDNENLDGVSDILALSQITKEGSPERLFRMILARGDTLEIVRAITLVFATRSPRGGKGFRDLAFTMFMELINNGEYIETVKGLLPLFINFGCWKDLFQLLAFELKTKGFVPKDGPKKRKRGNSRSEEVKEKNMEIAKTSVLLQPVTHLVEKQWKKDIESLSKFKIELEELKEHVGEESDEYQARKVEGPSISLLAKWLPREGADIDRRTGFVGHFSAKLYPTSNAGAPSGSIEEAQKPASASRYRKQVAELTSYFDLPEVLMAANRADEINFARVASKARYTLTKAFLNQNVNSKPQDSKRQRCKDNFITHMATKGLKGKVTPHELIKSVLRNKNQMSKDLEHALDTQWKDLWANLWEASAQNDRGDSETRRLMVPICDMSGASDTTTETSIAIAIGLAEGSNHLAFKNKILTFESNPQWITFNKEDSIAEKVRVVSRAAAGGGKKNFSKVFEALLEQCIKSKVPRSQLPTPIVLSDSPIEIAGNYQSHKKAMMWKTIQKMTKVAGKKIGWPKDGGMQPPPVVFWNIPNTGGKPFQKDERGNVLLTGYSQSLLNAVVEGDIFNKTVLNVEASKSSTTEGTTQNLLVASEESLIEMLDDPIYDCVRHVLGESTEGALREYECLVDIEAEIEPAEQEEMKSGDGFEMI